MKRTFTYTICIGGLASAILFGLQHEWLSLTWTLIATMGIILADIYEHRYQKLRIRFDRSTEQINRSYKIRLP